MVEIVASLMAEEPGVTLRRARAAVIAGANWIELRLDRWPEEQDLAPVVGEMGVPVVVACRVPADGGFFTGSSGARRALLMRALHAGARGLDLEDWESWTPPKGQVEVERLVRSHHCLKGVPDNLIALRDRLFAKRCDLAKIVVAPDDLADAGPVLDLLLATDQQATPTVAFAMGRTSWPIRVLSALLGSPWTYASATPGAVTAAGQVPVEDLVQLYRLDQVGPATSIIGLLGNPALHSPGPLLHNRAMRQMGFDGVYLPFETSRPTAVLAMLPRHRLRGLSVTAPFKEAMVHHCHRLDPAAAATGAVNTMTTEAHGMVVGHNTDVHGVVAALGRAGLQQAAPGETAAVLGTGGAARAGAIALQQLGFEVALLGRTLGRAREFTRKHGFRLGSLRTEALQELAPRVVVHATPVGSDAVAPGERVVPDWQIPAGTYVLDMVYRPHWTPLLCAAQQAGAVPVPGRWMFVAQAARQLELFCGRAPPIEDLERFMGE